MEWRVFHFRIIEVHKDNKQQELVQGWKENEACFAYVPFSTAHAAKARAFGMGEVGDQFDEGSSQSNTTTESWAESSSLPLNPPITYTLFSNFAATAPTLSTWKFWRCIP